MCLTENAVHIQLPSGKSIKMVSAAYFLITKLEAFDGRGAGDYLMSHDIEDIIACRCDRLVAPFPDAQIVCRDAGKTRGCINSLTL
jgi:hypothetical protein